MMSLELALKAHRVEDFTQADHNYNLAYKKRLKIVNYTRTTGLCLGSLETIESGAGLQGRFEFLPNRLSNNNELR